MDELWWWSLWALVHKVESDHRLSFSQFRTVVTNSKCSAKFLIYVAKILLDWLSSAFSKLACFGSIDFLFSMQWKRNNSQFFMPLCSLPRGFQHFKGAICFDTYSLMLVNRWQWNLASQQNLFRFISTKCQKEKIFAGHNKLASSLSIYFKS